MLLQCSPLKFPVETRGPRAATATLRAPYGHSRAQRPLTLQRDWLSGIAFSVFFSQKARKCERSSFLSSRAAQPATVTPCMASSRLRTEGISVPDILLPDSEDLAHPHFSMTGRGAQRHQRNVHESHSRAGHMECQYHCPATGETRPVVPWSPAQTGLSLSRSIQPS